MNTGRLQKHVRHWRGVASALGVAGAAAFYAKEKIAGLSRAVGGDAAYRLQTPDCDERLWVRAGTSDRHVFGQIFIAREYEAIADINPRFIIDCGANVGYSTAYFASKYPNARIVSVEPDEANFAVLARNAAAFGERITPLQAAVWPYTTGLKLVRGDFRDGREWTTQVRPIEDSEEPDVEGISLSDILSDSGFEEVDLLKIDVERAEEVLFSENYMGWLPAVRYIAIELHDEMCRSVFNEALQRSGHRYRIAESGELTLARRLS